jgi:hypothetical protein
MLGFEDVLPWAAVLPSVSMTPRANNTRPRDLNRLAASIVEEATSSRAPEAEGTPLSEVRRQSGAKGGHARAKNLSPDERAEIAKRAARARWEQKS